MTTHRSWKTDRKGKRRMTNENMYIVRCMDVYWIFRSHIHLHDNYLLRRVSILFARNPIYVLAHRCRQFQKRFRQTRKHFHYSAGAATTNHFLFFHFFFILFLVPFHRFIWYLVRGVKLCTSNRQISFGFCLNLFDG